MKIIMICALVAVAVCANAEEKIRCNIRSDRDAQACMNRIADTYVNDVKTENEALISKNWGPAVTVFNGIGIKEELIQKLKKADWVGVVLNYTYAENHLIYFAIKKGKNVTPEELYDLNLVDLSDSLPPRLKKDSALANPNTYLLGNDSKEYPYIHDSIAEELEEVWENQNEGD